MFEFVVDTPILRSGIVSYSTLSKKTYHTTPTKVLLKRDDSTSSTTTSSSSASKTKTAKCTGSKQECELPTNSSRTTAITVGVAVAVPVVVVAILLCVILYIVYKRSKKEEQEDNDPEFEGDSEYLPQHNTYEMNQQFSSSDSNQNPPEKNNHAFYNGMSMAPPGASMQQYPHPAANPFDNRNSSWTTDPFQLPETENVESLREFAKHVQNDGLGGYQLASRNGSQLSLPTRTMNIDQASFSSANRSSNMHVMANQSGPSNPAVVTNGSIGDNNASNLNSRNGSPLKDVSTIPRIEERDGSEYMVPEKLTFSQEVQSVENDDEENFDFEYRNNTDHDTNNYNNINQENQSDEREENEYNATNPHQLENEKEYASSSPLSPEEENVQRMKSIYKVYLDKDENAQDHSTTKPFNNKNAGNINTAIETNPHELNNNDFSNNEMLPAQNSNEPMLGDQNVNIPQVKVERYDGQEITNDENNVYNDMDNNRISHRIASSIYSEIPPSAYIPNQQQWQQQQQQQYGYYNYNPNMTMQQPQFYNNYPPLPNMPSQYVHPQTLEEIDELPMPSKLVHSGSSHSLTSFKAKSKLQNQQQQTQSPLHGLQPVIINGTAVNPMDHPEMFYSNNIDEMENGHFQQQAQYPNNSSMSFTSSSNHMNSVPSPYQMRKSIVMTNPAELQVSTTFKPAGSIRNLGPQQQSDPYTQQIHSRVSGILDNSDMIQPPSMGGILPHSGSQEDLRKQLGSSDNYNLQ